MRYEDSGSKSENILKEKYMYIFMFNKFFICIIYYLVKYIFFSKWFKTQNIIIVTYKWIG